MVGVVCCNVWLCVCARARVHAVSPSWHPQVPCSLRSGTDCVLRAAPYPQSSPSICSPETHHQTGLWVGPETPPVRATGQHGRITRASKRTKPAETFTPSTYCTCTLCTCINLVFNNMRCLDNHTKQTITYIPTCRGWCHVMSSNCPKFVNQSIRFYPLYIDSTQQFFCE